MNMLAKGSIWMYIIIASEFALENTHAMPNTPEISNPLEHGIDDIGWITC